MNEMRERLIQLLSRYFDIGDSYTYNLTRVKSAFAVGTIDLDDFEEYTEDDVADLADHLLDNGVIVLPCKIGDTVYRICKRKYDVDGYGMQFIEDWGIIRNAFSLKMYHELGKTVFLTREAAEEVLKAREGGSE